MSSEWRRDSLLISTDKQKLQVGMIHGFLKNAYWCKNIPRDVVERSIENSLSFGVYDENVQIGYAKVISDFATIAYLGDLFIIEEYRGRGLSKWLMDSIVNHPDLQGLRRWILGTLDAHGLYEQYGFENLHSPDRWMERWDRDVYSKS